MPRRSLRGTADSTSTLIDCDHLPPSLFFAHPPYPSILLQHTRLGRDSLPFSHSLNQTKPHHLTPFTPHRGIRHRARDNGTCKSMNDSPIKTVQTSKWLNDISAPEPASILIYFAIKHLLLSLSSTSTLSSRSAPALIDGTTPAGVTTICKDFTRIIRVAQISRNNREPGTKGYTFGKDCSR